MACKQSPCEKDLCDVYVELRKLIGNIDEFPLSPDKAGTVENHLKQLYDLTSMLLEQNDFQIVGSLDEMKEDGRLYVLRSTKSAYITINGSAFPISGSDSAVAESDPIYQADKALLALKSEVTPIAEKLNDLVEATTIVNDKLEHEITARFEADENLQEQIENEINDRFDSETDLQGQIDDEISARENADITLNDKLTNEATVRGAADTLALNKINANTSQISANTTSIATNKNLQDLVNTQYLNKITALENKTGKLIVTKNTGETDAQALARVITAPVDGMAAFVYDPNAHGNSDNLTEYLRINSAWIEQGTHTATIDLTAYYTKTESDAKFIDTVELQNLFNSYFEWIGAKRFTVVGRLPDVTTQPTTGTATDVNKVVAYEGEDWFLFEINKAGTITYVWQPVAAANTYSAGDTFDRDSVVEFFTSPDGIHNLKILTGAKDVQDYTFAEGVQRDLHIAPNAKGQISVGLFDLNAMNTSIEAIKVKNNEQDTKIASIESKNSQQDTAISGKQDHTVQGLTTTAKTVDGSINEINAKVDRKIENPIGTFENDFVKFNKTANTFEIITYPNMSDKTKYIAMIWDKQYSEFKIENYTTAEGVITTIAGDAYSIRNRTQQLLRIFNDGKHNVNATHTLIQLLDFLESNYTNIGSIGDKQNKAIALTGITATNVEGALVELAGKSGTINDKLNISATGVTFDANGHVIEGTTNTGKNYTEYIVGKSLAGLPASPITVSTAISSSTGYVTWSKTKTFAIGEEFTIITHKSDKTHANIIKLTSLSQNINLGLGSSGTLNLTVLNGNINNVNIDLTPVDWVKVVY